jgi:hypothetical protein
MNIQQHIEELPDAEAYQDLVKSLRALPEQAPSPAFHSETLARMKAGQRVAFWRSSWVGIAASLALLLSAGALVLSTRPTSSSDIQWLLTQQEKDGTWNPSRHGGNEQFRPALTALSVLALDRSSPRASQSIQKAMTALGRLQTADGGFAGGDSQARAYNLAMTTFALATCPAVQSQAKPIIQRSVEAITASQLANGSWDYASTPEGNVALTSWMVRALKSAEASGVDTTSVAQRKGLRWLMRMTAQADGNVSYKPATAPSETVTALTAISFITAGQAFPDIQCCAMQMTEQLNSPSTREGQRDCYRDYAKIMALELAGKRDHALRIRNEMKTLLNVPDTWRVAGGDLYTTTFTALCM